MLRTLKGPLWNSKTSSSASSASDSSPFGRFASSLWDWLVELEAGSYAMTGEEDVVQSSSEFEKMLVERSPREIYLRRFNARFL